MFLSLQIWSWKIWAQKKIPCETPMPFQSQARRRHSPSCRWRSPATAEVPRRPPAQRRPPPSPTHEASGAPGGDEAGAQGQNGEFLAEETWVSHSLTNQNGELYNYRRQIGIWVLMHGDWTNIFVGDVTDVSNQNGDLTWFKYLKQ